jgi:hypothetical protein
MANVLTARFEESMTGAGTRLVFDGLPANAVGRSATAELRLKVNTKRSRGIDEHRTVLSQTFKVSGARYEMPIGDQLHELYSYVGSSIDIDLLAHIEIDDGFIFDTKMHTEIERELLRSPAPKGNAAQLIEPADAYNFRANLRAIPPKNRMIVMVLSIVGSILIGINTLLGAHDEFTSSDNIVFYDHSGSDGSESPMMKSLFGSGGLGLTVWLAIRAQLRRYMKIELNSAVRFPRRGSRLAARDLIRGQARVALEKTKVRVVAVNDEKGQYEEGSGTKKRTVSFTTPFRGVLIYEQYLPFIPANTPVENYLEGELDFEEMFEVLYPPLQTSSTHGIGLRWEVQLIHPQFVDQELACPCDGLVFADFIPQSR